MTERKFATIEEALKYRELCPLCGAKLDIDRPMSEHTIEICLQSSYTLVNIDISSNKVKTITEKRPIQTVYDVCGNVIQVNMGPAALAAGSLIYDKITMSCGKCYDYYCVIQLLYDFDKLQVTNICFNSEKVTFQDTDTWYSIRNIYTTEQTELECWGNSLNPETLAKLPLVELDLQNPRNTINKLKSILLFL
jgi:hypothetical protein